MLESGGVATAAQPQPEKAAVWEDFIDIFYEPRAVYERRRGGKAWPVLLVLTLLLVALFYAWQHAFGAILDVEMQRAAMKRLAEGTELTSDQIQQMRRIGRMFGVIGFAVTFPIGVALTALVTWIVARAMGAVTTFAAMMLVVTYAQIVRVPQFVAGLIESFVMDVSRLDSIHDVGFSAARFMAQPSASPVLLNLATRADVFTLWATALIAIGLEVVAKMPRGKAWATAGLVWIIAALPQVIGAFFSR